MMLSKKSVLIVPPQQDGDTKEILKLNSQIKPRKCLRCGRVWRTTRTHRICPRCAESEGYKAAMREAQYEAHRKVHVAGELDFSTLESDVRLLASGTPANAAEPYWYGN